MTTGRINQVAIVQEATSLSAPRPRRKPPPNTTASAWFSNTAVAELFPTASAAPAPTHTSANSRVPRQRHPLRWIPGSFFSSEDDKNAPPSFDSFVNLLPRQHPSNKGCQALSDTQTRTQRFPTRAPLVWGIYDTQPRLRTSQPRAPSPSRFHLDALSFVRATY